MLPAYPQAGTHTNPFSLPPLSQTHVDLRRIKAAAAAAAAAGEFGVTPHVFPLIFPSCFLRICVLHVVVVTVGRGLLPTGDCSLAGGPSVNDACVTDISAADMPERLWLKLSWPACGAYGCAACACRLLYTCHMSHVRLGSSSDYCDCPNSRQRADVQQLINHARGGRHLKSA
jgi:hypothetical protein